MRRLTVITGSVLAFGLLTACTGQSHGSSRGLAGGGSAGSASVGAVAGGVPQPAPVNASGAATGAGAQADAAAVRAPGPSVIRTADITVSTAAVDRQADRARAIVAATGGSVDGDDRSSGPHATATMTLRVPPAQLDAVLTQLSALGREQTRHLSTQDVTTQVVDVDSRVQSAAAAIAELRDLYAKATRVADIIAIESELAQREADLESLQAQQRTLAGQVAMATVTLYLVTPPAAVVHRHTTHGFGGGLAKGWHAFTRTITLIVTGIGAALPFVLVLAVGAGAWLVGRGRRNRARPTPPAASDPVS